MNRASTTAAIGRSSQSITATVPTIENRAENRPSRPISSTSSTDSTSLESRATTLPEGAASW